MTSNQAIPLLKLLHLTDMHWTENRRRSAQIGLQLRRVFSFLPDSKRRKILDKWYEGTREDDIPARRRLRDLIAQEFPITNSVPSKVVLTGDQTTFGDQASKDALNNWLTDSIDKTSVDEIIAIHGNHDVWPDTQPILDPIGSASATENRNFNPAKVSLLNQPIKIDLFPLNTVTQDAARNFFAYGTIRFNQLALHQTTRDSGAISIAICHHPFASAAYSPGEVGMVILDAGHNAHIIDHLGLYNLVISGHTHKFLPMSDYSPLSGTHQLVTGATFQNMDQMPPLTLDPFESHQATVLEFFQRDRQVEVRTRLFYRQNNRGPYIVYAKTNLPILRIDLR